MCTELPAVPARRVRKNFTRSTGATSGSETYAIAGILVLLVALLFGLEATFCLLASTFLLQISVLAPLDGKIFFYFTFSQKFGPAVMRNASIGFMECVRPGGKPTKDHCLHL